MTETPRSVAIIGSGPAGCYLAQALRRKLPESSITIIERLPVPYGLLRYGVAADHQGTKAVSRQFDRLFDRDGVQFVGNVAVGSDVSMADVRAAFDAVIVSSGLTDDVTLAGVAGADLPGVYGAGLVTRALNGHPEAHLGDVTAGERAVIIGAGNVAIDIVRLLAKHADQLGGSDIDDDLRDRLAAGLSRIEVVGRSSAGLAKCDLAMLRELGTLDDVAIEFHESPAPPTGDETAFSDDEEAIARRTLLAELAARDVVDPRTTISFRFGLVPVAILGDDRVTGVTVSTTDGAGVEFDLAADSVFTAIGFRQSRDDALRRDSLAGPSALPEDGRLDEYLYCAGWLRTGPRGTIPTHRSEAKVIAEMVADDLARLETDPAPGVDSFRTSISTPWVDWDGWRRIDEHERTHASPDRVRSKIRSITTMLSIATEGETISVSQQEEKE